MRRRTLLGILSQAIIITTSMVRLAAADVSPAEKQSLAIAKSYEEKAVEQEKVIGESSGLSRNL